MTQRKKPKPKSISEGKKLPAGEREKLIETDATLAYFIGSVERTEHQREIKHLKELLAEERSRKPAATPEEDLRFFSFFGKTASFLHSHENDRAEHGSDALKKTHLLWLQEVAFRKATVTALNNLRSLVGEPTQICPKCGKVEWSKVMQTLLCPDCARS